MNPSRLSGLRHQVVKTTKVSLRTVYRSQADARTLRSILEACRGRDLMRPREVAMGLGVSVSTVYRWVYEGRLEAISILGCVRIPGDQILDFENHDRTGPVCPTCLRFRADNGLRRDGADAACPTPGD
jgi:excisionase family DNA binding protein